MKNDENGTFQLAGKQINYRIQQNKKVKYYGLSFLPGQGLVIQVPKTISQTEIFTILNRHRRWILNRLRKANIIQDNKQKFHFNDGAKLQALDEKYTLSFKIRPDHKMYWQQKGKILEICLTEHNQNWLSQIIVHWYKLMAREFLNERVFFWAKKMKVDFNQVRVKDQKSLWGSCSKKKNLNFNWRIMLLASKVADYLIVHELAHLIQLNHSSKFWNIVETYLPNYKYLKQKIKEKNYLLRFP